MNQQQRKYVLERISAIEDQAAKKIADKHTTVGVYLTWDMKRALINSGEVKLLRDTRGYKNVEDAFDWSKHERKKKINSAALSADLAKLGAQATKARDELMLGDTAEALALIQRLESFAASL